jgi:hypothetical protein
MNATLPDFYGRLCVTRMQCMFPQTAPVTIVLTTAMRAGEGQMDKRTGRLVAAIGIDRAAAPKAVGGFRHICLPRGAEGAHASFSLAGAAHPQHIEPNAGCAIAMLGGGTDTGVRVTAAGRDMRAAGSSVLQYARMTTGGHAAGIVGAIPGRPEFL